MIDVDDIDQAELLAALYNAIDLGKRYGLTSFPEPISVDDARQLIAERTRDGVCRFDYLNGRPLKIELAPVMNERLYDRENGAGAFQRVVDKLRGSFVKEHEIGFFVLRDGELEPCRDQGEAFREPVRVFQRLELPSKSQVRKERRRPARAGVHGRRAWREKTRRISRVDAEWRLTPMQPRRDIIMRAHRFGAGAQVADYRKPRELWPTVTRRAVVYVAEGETIPDDVKARLERDLQWATANAAQKLYERLNEH